MLHTEYSFLTTKELIEFAALSDGRTSLERELAHRLQIASDMLESDDATPIALENYL